MVHFRENNVFWLWGLAFLLRILWVWQSGQMGGLPKDNLYDDGVYLDMALAVIGRSTAGHITHPPGYAIFLAPFMLLGSWGIPVARLAQLALGAGLAPLTHYFSRTLGFSHKAAWVAGILVAIHPMFIYFSARFMSDTLFSFLVLMFFLIWFRAWTQGVVSAAALAGLLGGAASLTRGVLLPFSVVLAAVSFLRRREQPQWAKLLVACAMTWILTLVPWTAYNWKRFGRFVPISVQGGWNFYEGLTLDLDEILWKRSKAMGEEVQALGLKDLFEVDAYFGRKARLWVQEHPKEFVYLILRKAVKFWRFVPYRPHPKIIRWGVGVFTFIVFGLALLGLRRGAWAHRYFPFLIAWASYLTLLHALFASNLRYRLPLEPFIAILAGVGLCALW